MLTASGYGLGAAAAFTEGPCADGHDFLCGERGGVMSCRPCDFPQLGTFQELQKQANRLVPALGDSKFALVIDGRIGPLTARTVGRVGMVAMRHLSPPAGEGLDSVIALASQSPESGVTLARIAAVAPDLAGYFRAAADALGVPKQVPAPPGLPPGTGTRPPTTTEPPVTTPPPLPAPKRSRAGVVLAVVGGLTAIGLVAGGIYQYRKRAA